MLAPWKKSYDQSRQRIKKQRHYFANKDHLVKAMGFFSVVMCGCERQRNGNPGQYSCLENPMGSQRVRHDWVTKLQQHGCESWTIKKAEPQKNRCFWTVVLERLLRVPWITGRPNQSNLKEISPEYSLEELMLKLNLQYFDHLMWRTDALEKTLMMGKI